MSGAILSGIGAASAIGNVLFGNSGAVVLGDVVFSDMEVPAEITWGGRQTLTIHKMPGGLRVIDAMGRDDAAISWSGIFLGQDHGSARALQLDELRVSGKLVPLSWGDHLLTVVVAAFQCTDTAFQGKYRITCEVLQDESAGFATRPQSLLGAIMSGINDALALVAPIFALVGIGQAIVSGLTSKQATACATLAGDLDDAQATVRGVGSFAAGDSSSADVQAAVAAVQASAADVCDGAETALAAIVEQPEVGFLGTYDAATALDRLNVATAQSAVGAAAWVAASEAQRAMDNLTATPGATEAAAAFDSAVPSPQSVGGAAGQTIMQAGGDLYTVAARELGDATQWYRVAMSSGLDDPMLYGLNALTVPDAIQATSPGLPDVAGSEIL